MLRAGILCVPAVLAHVVHEVQHVETSQRGPDGYKIQTFKKKANLVDGVGKEETVKTQEGTNVEPKMEKTTKVFEGGEKVKESKEINTVPALQDAEKDSEEFETDVKSGPSDSVNEVESSKQEEAKNEAPYNGPAPVQQVVQYKKAPRNILSRRPAQTYTFDQMLERNMPHLLQNLRNSPFMQMFQNVQSQFQQEMQKMQKEGHLHNGHSQSFRSMTTMKNGERHTQQENKTSTMQNGVKKERYQRRKVHGQGRKAKEMIQDVAYELQAGKKPVLRGAKETRRMYKDGKVELEDTRDMQPSITY